MTAEHLRLFDESENIARYVAMLGDLSAFPIRFTYEGNHFQGFSPDLFREISHSTTNNDRGVRTDTIKMAMRLDKNVQVTLISSLQAHWGMISWKIYISNTSKNDSGIFSLLKCVDLTLEGENPILEGIAGDCVPTGQHYRPYRQVLKDGGAHFNSGVNRSSEIVFPYFHLQTEEFGLFLALGFPGSWEFDAKYDGQTHLLGCGIPYLDTVLHPGEEIRTPWVVLLLHRAAKTEDAMNFWRQFYLDQILPRENGKDNRPLGNLVSFHGSSDIILKMYHSAGVAPDILWRDADWYQCPKPGGGSNWYDTVGTWVAKPELSEKMKLDAATAKQYGIRTMQWFEPERITFPENMEKDWGYDPHWAVRTPEYDYIWLNNYARARCADWTFARIRQALDAYGIDIYREDHNFRPYTWLRLAEKEQEGTHRNGILESTYVEEHFRLWRKIEAYLNETKGTGTFLDSCASGGCRNDIETMTYAVPFLRSDADDSYCGADPNDDFHDLKLSMTTSLCHWLPWHGCGQAFSSLHRVWEDPVQRKFNERASYLPMLKFDNRDEDGVLTVKELYDEWKLMCHFTLQDFYALTPWHSDKETDSFTAYEFFNADRDRGVLLAFRQERCTSCHCTLQPKGTHAEHTYYLRDMDGVQSQTRTGKELAQGLTVTLERPFSSAMLLIERVRFE